MRHLKTMFAFSKQTLRSIFRTEPNHYDEQYILLLLAPSSRRHRIKWYHKQSI